MEINVLGNETLHYYIQYVKKCMLFIRNINNIQNKEIYSQMCARKIFLISYVQKIIEECIDVIVALFD